ncbi:MAG: histone deacetylase family protein [Ilumatobacteraceae bacterium]
MSQAVEARLTMPVVVAPDHVHHDVATGVWCGVTEATDELPARAEIIATACAAAGARMVEAEDHGLDALRRVHDERFLDVLQTAHRRWVADGHLESPGIPYVTPYFFPPVAGRHGGTRLRGAATIRAEIGFYAMDTLTCIGSGTWTGAKAASDAAATAADLVAGGERVAYAVCRPPGHHAGRAFFGGSCYRNNAAVAAACLRDRGAGRVAVIDIDAHHGNGTQAIFWNDPSVFYGSVHVDPAAGWFPHTVGHADEVDDTGTNCNMPVHPVADDGDWLNACTTLLATVRSFRPDAVVVSLGVDAAVDDPNSPLLVTDRGFAAIGRMLAGLDRPTVFVHEGGYVLQTLAEHTLAVLGGFES